MYDWTQKLHPIYNKAVALYAEGKRGAESYFDVHEEAFLASIGLKAINVYDHAEDLVKYKEPDWETFLLVVAARRDYFLYEQNGHAVTSEITESELPKKDAELDGIRWLPRIIRKARSFLEGDLCHDIMYGCGGDRNFLKEHNIHTADFLRAVWAAHGDDQAILEFLRKGKA